MYKLGGSDEYVTCPFNKAHEVQRIRYQAHILKCRKQHPNIKLVACFYNFKHLLKAEDMPKHLAECADKQRLEGSRYGSSTASVPVVEKDDEKEESVISFGSDFRDCLSNDDCSSVISRASSSLRGRGNALVKMGPLGNLSRYSMNQRTPKWENTEIDFLKTYDQVVSDYVPAPISPDPSPRKGENQLPISNTVAVKKKLMEEEIKPKQLSMNKKLDSEKLKPEVAIVNKKEKEEEFKPLPLPKTTSKAFAPVRSLQDEMNIYENRIESQNKTESKVNCDKKQKIKPTMKKYPKYYDEDYDSNEKKVVNYDAFIFNPVEIDNENNKSDSSYYRNQFFNHNYSKIIGRSKGFDDSLAERRPGGLVSLLPDTSDLDDQVPKRNTERNQLFLKSGYSLFPDHDNDGNMSDDTANYEDADGEDEDQEGQEEEDSKECPLLVALNKFVKKKEALRKENRGN